MVHLMAIELSRPGGRRAPSRRLVHAPRGLGRAPGCAHLSASFRRPNLHKRLSLAHRPLSLARALDEAAAAVAARRAEVSPAAALLSGCSAKTNKRWERN